ncbi:MAG: GHMP kinase [Candidatus Omnitrophota bacterium]|jgi:D-glycero-alpha-D-manno-heptose-7-phosphate kinase|nr:MAG: GHMP kinase [Candidatus Omnitrophota bacterium]
MAGKLIRSRAPVRVDFAGGWTDVSDFCRETAGYVVNAAINIYSFVTISEEKIPDPGTDPTLQERGVVDQKGITLYSSDFDLYIQAKTIRDLEYDGNIDLVKAAVRQLGVDEGFSLITQSIAPPGSGLGTSASMGVALLAALNRYADRHLLAYELAEEASRIEREELGILGGKQDHYASAMGSISFLEFRGEQVRSSKLNVSRNVILELEKNLVLCYTGQSRLSGEVHARVKERFENKDEFTVGAIEEMKQIASDMKSALLNENMKDFAELLSRNWDCQKRLHPSVTNETIETIFSAATENGAIGGKACGAGGGGCVLFYCRPEREHQVRRALEKEGAMIIDFNIDFFGSETWEVAH